MLQQILRDLWVDPAILAELDDDQRQTLFCKMREEQVRRWRIWDAATVIPERRSPPPGSKSVQFLAGKDGEPWVWVMGEHPDDLSIEEILEREARDKARQQAQLEAEELRKKVEDELSGFLAENVSGIETSNCSPMTGPVATPLPAPNESPPPPPLPPRQISPPPLIESFSVKMNGNGQHPDEDIYCSVDELRAKSKATAFSMDGEPTNDRMKKPVSERVAQWERRLLEERTAEILGRLRRRRMDSVREAEEAAADRERLWQEQERRAKQAEQQIREIARRAREEHRRASMLDKNCDSTNIIQTPPPSPIGLSAVAAASIAAPMGREAVCKWFWSSEVPRGAGISESGKPEPWFHGLISRQEAEARLEGKPAGTFLVRVSERIRGYAISYRDRGRCKHFLVDCSGPFYQFLGAGQIGHVSLCALVRHHRERPITQVGAERLLVPCPCSTPPEILRVGNSNL